MANSNLIQRLPATSLWLFIAGMFAFNAFIIGLIFYLAEAGVLYDTLNLYLQDPNVDRLVMKVQALENEIQDLEDEVARLTAEVDKANDYLKDVHFRQEQAALGLLLGMAFIVTNVSLHLAGG